MVSFEVPFAQLSDGLWSVSRNHAEGAHFSSRVDALNYAVQEANRLANRGVLTMISIEGADGQWRAFDPKIKHFM